MTFPILKVSVLVSGAVLLDGEPVSLQGLKARLQSLKDERGAVWYFREAAGGEPPAEAMQVMKMVVDNRLPVSLCSKADFSDYVDLKGVSHPRYATWDAAVAMVRERTASGKYVGVIRPDRSYLLVAPPPKDSVPRQMVQMMEKLVPPRPLRNIGVIADTYFAFNVSGRIPNLPSLVEIGQSIPFFGMLLGLASIGHSVCVFPGTDESLVPGCKDADLLVVDDAQVPSLAADWKQSAKAAMRSPNILVHDRASFKLTPVAIDSGPCGS
jgi:hypothetical protein